MSFKSVLFVFLGLFLLSSCNSVSAEEKALREKAKARLTNPTQAGKQTTADKDRINKNNDNKVTVDPNLPTTTIQFKKEKYNFGTINEGEKAKHSYSFTNVGSKPLIIQNAKASCGCTVPTYAKEPVAPGETGTIDVVFDSKGRPGKVSKTVTITANTEPAKTVLFLTGEVKRKKK